MLIELDPADSIRMLALERVVVEVVVVEVLLVVVVGVVVACVVAVEVAVCVVVVVQTFPGVMRKILFEFNGSA